MRACEWASERPCGSQLINQVAPASSIYNPVGCARAHFPCRLPASLFTRWFGVSLIRLSLALSSTPTCWLLLIHSLSPANAYLFFSLGAQLILETTRGYCWRLVFLGIYCSNPLKLSITSTLEVFLPSLFGLTSITGELADQFFNRSLQEMDFMRMFDQSR